MTDKKVIHSELGDNLRDEAAKQEPGELRNRLEVLAAWADNQVQWFRGFMTGNEALHQEHQKLEKKLDAVNELIKPQWRSYDYDRNKLLDDLREAVGMRIASIPEMDDEAERRTTETIKRIAEEADDFEQLDEVAMEKRTREIKEYREKAALIRAVAEIIDPSILEPNRSNVIEAMNAVDLPNGERFMLESEAYAEDKARTIFDQLKEYK